MEKTATSGKSRLPEKVPLFKPFSLKASCKCILVYIPSDSYNLLFLEIRLPDSPIEADPEVPLERTESAPTVIPLDDVTGNPESVYDHRHLPWPEPKTTPYVPLGYYVPQQQELQQPQQFEPSYRSPAVPAPKGSKLSFVNAIIKKRALQKQTETIQKAQLNLGTVLLSEIGSNKSEEAGKVTEQQQVAKQSESQESNPAAATGSSSEDGAPSSQVAAAEPKSTNNTVEVVKHSTATPNLSAWFKFLGPPRIPSNGRCRRHRKQIAGRNLPSRKESVSRKEATMTRRGTFD